MRTKAYLTIIITLIATSGVIGLIETVSAKSDGSQRLRGLEGRAFAIQGEWLRSSPDLPPVGFTFENCYTFNDDGTWVDPEFPAPSFWIQHTPGPKIQYTAIGDGSAFGALLVQNGTVIPGRRDKGRPRLVAYSTLYIFGAGVVAEIVSRGYEVEECSQ